MCKLSNMLYIQQLPHTSVCTMKPGDMLICDMPISSDPQAIITQYLKKLACYLPKKPDLSG